MVDLAILAACVLLGHGIHLLKKTVEARQDGADIGIHDLVMSRPYRTILGLCGSAAAFAVLWELGQLTVVSALGVGYMADSGLALLQRTTDRRV